MDQETILTRKRYNRTALFYDWMDTMIKSDLRSELLSGVTGKVLEVGVGTGKNLEFYPSEYEVTGIDISPGMLEKAKPRAREAKAFGNFQASLSLRFSSKKESRVSFKEIA